MKRNPLLEDSTFPQFKRIKATHIVPALVKVLDENRAKIETLCKTNEPVSWQNFVEPLEGLGEKIDRIWSPVSHLNAVKDSDALRTEVEKALPLLSNYSTEMGQNTHLFARFKALAKAPEFDDMTQAQHSMIENEIRDFELSGVALNKADKARYKSINEALAKLGHQYQQNVLDATQAWALLIKDKKDLAGLPKAIIKAARQSAREAGKKGWRFSLQDSAYVPFMKYADNRKLRRKMYEAFVTRASDQGPMAGRWDNTKTMQEIILLRQKKARLLGLDHYADYSLKTKMAENVKEVETFLLDLATRSRDAAQNEWHSMAAFARKTAEIDELQAWDMAYYAEKLKQQTFDLSDEELRPYFPLDKVLNGLLDVVERLFGMTVHATKRPEVWHKDIQFFEIRDSLDQLRGWFYLDLYAREHKRSGAWMADCTNRRKSNNNLQLPVAFINCNVARPIGNQAALLLHDDVITLFHEFGHGLHHMLTQVDVSSVAGIHGVPWDGVELPSQFLENWCWQREALDIISGHVDTGSPLPDEMLQKMLAAKNFQSAMQMLRQIEFSLFDLRLHLSTNPVIDIQAVLESVRKEVAIVEPPVFNRFAHCFEHIFGGGYAAGYYSYKWAEVLSADAFGRFEEEGVFNAQTGQDFLKNILEKGGSESPMVLFERFRGRKPSIESLLRHSGL